jgi:hypothetical protein
MNARLVLVLVLLIALVAFVAWLFIVQNSARTTQLSLDLGFAAWQLQRPIAIPALLGISFGSGFALGALLFLGRSSAASRKLKTLERRAALGETSFGSSYASPAPAEKRADPWA